MLFFTPKGLHASAQGLRSAPWAEACNPFGVKNGTASGESKQGEENTDQDVHGGSLSMYRILGFHQRSA